MKKWLQNIVAGRYGSDELSFTLLLIYLGICIFGIFCDLPLVQLLGLAIILWAFFRILSRNIPARQAENAAYLGFLSKCSAAHHARAAAARPHAPLLPLPGLRRHHARTQGRRQIEITCPKCGRKITKRPEQTGPKHTC